MNERELPRIAVDGDGVVADFDKLAYEIFGMSGQAYEDLHGSAAFWQGIEDHPDFFGSLELMPDALDLFDAIRHLEPIFISGVPFGGWASPQKERWFARHFPGIPLFTCPSKDKYLYMPSRGAVLIDDFLKHRHVWEGAGGIFVHHTSAADSLAQLRAIGFDI